MDKKLLLLIIFPFIGCTSPNAVMRSWVGHNENELYQQWGTPSKVIDNGSNGKIVKYVPDRSKKDSSQYRYISASEPARYPGARINGFRKVKSFYITPMGNIYAWKWEKAP